MLRSVPVWRGRPDTGVAPPASALHARRRLFLTLAALPIAATVALEWLGAIQTSNIQRLLTGLPLGFAAGVVIVRSLSGQNAPAGDI